MTNRIEVTGVLPDMTLTIPGGSITVTQWPTMTPEAGRPLWESVGVCSHHFGKGVYADVDAWTQKVADVGWYAFRSGAFSQLDQVKRMVVRARELGFKVLGVLANMKDTTEKQLRANLDFVAANADVFIGVEGINEPDKDGLTSVKIEKTVVFQRIIWEYFRTKPELAHITVLSPALRRPAGPDLYQRFVNAGLLRPQPFHAVSLHHYGKAGMIRLDGPDGLTEHIDMVQSIWQCDRFWITETGSTNALESPDPRHCTEEASAAYSVRNIFDVLDDPRMEKVFRYELLDDAAPLTNNEAHFGLWRVDGSRKPEIAAVSELLTSLDDTDLSPVELEVTGPQGVHLWLVGQTLWLWRPGVAFDAESVDVQVATPSGTRMVQVGGAALGVPLEV